MKTLAHILVAFIVITIFIFTLPLVMLYNIGMVVSIAYHQGFNKRKVK